MQTILVDPDVYQWLQSLARPFEDSPNTVLRRLGGLDKVATSNRRTEEASKSTSQPVRNRQLSGAFLNQEWNVGAKHALYHKDGLWYGNLEKFPGAYFDPSGFVVFETEGDYRNSPYLRISARTNLSRHLSEFPNYVRVTKTLAAQ